MWAIKITEHDAQCFYYDVQLWEFRYININIQLQSNYMTQVLKASSQHLLCCAPDLSVRDPCIVNYCCNSKKLCTTPVKWFWKLVNFCLNNKRGLPFPSDFAPSLLFLCLILAFSNGKTSPKLTDGVLAQYILKSQPSTASNESCQRLFYCFFISFVYLKTLICAYLLQKSFLTCSPQCKMSVWCIWLSLLTPPPFN